MFSKYGDIMSVKISLDANHESNGYGFVCFAKPEYASAAIQATSRADTCTGLKFSPKDKRDFQRVFNNIYVKNFPVDWSDDQLKTLFAKFGDIISCITMTNEAKTLKFGFVCYGREGDKDYGTRCAAEAVQALHGWKIDETHTMYCRPALSKTEREQEKTKEMIRYKNSKKRCNLYVKNFPPNTTTEQLKEYFSKYGDIESIKLFPKEGESLYAFVCFKNPDQALHAKTQCH
jgi:polyadenylate-binding protein